MPPSPGTTCQISFGGHTYSATLVDYETTQEAGEVYGHTGRVGRTRGTTTTRVSLIVDTDGPVINQELPPIQARDLVGRTVTGFRGIPYALPGGGTAAALELETDEELRARLSRTWNRASRSDAPQLSDIEAAIGHTEPVLATGDALDRLAALFNLERGIKAPDGTYIAGTAGEGLPLQPPTPQPISKAKTKWELMGTI